jgi:hypothetical protein
VQEDSSNKLPSVSGVNPAITQPEVLANESRLVGVEEKLSDEGDGIQADQSEQNDPRPLRPAPGE